MHDTDEEKAQPDQRYFPAIEFTQYLGRGDS
jgi:hypothetical protein